MLSIRRPLTLATVVLLTSSCSDGSSDAAPNSTGESDLAGQVEREGDEATASAARGAAVDSTADGDHLATADIQELGFGAVAVENSDAPDDPVDDESDVSWIQQETLAAGHSMLRVLMTDAPVDADNVFVTFCGVYVEPSLERSADDNTREERGEEVRGVEVDEDDGPRGDEREHPVSHADAGSENGDDTWIELSDAAANFTVPQEGDAGAAREPLLDDQDAAAESVEAPRESSEMGHDLHRSDAGMASADADQAEFGYALSEECRTLDLLELRNGVTEALGVLNLPAGDYGRIRLMLTDASIVVDGEEHALRVPSGAQSGIKIGAGFALDAGIATTLTIDFDAAESVHHTPGQGYVMRPVIRLAKETRHEAGTIMRDAGTPQDGGARPERGQRPTEAHENERRASNDHQGEVSAEQRPVDGGTDQRASRPNESDEPVRSNGSDTPGSEDAADDSSVSRERDADEEADTDESIDENQARTDGRVESERHADGANARGKPGADSNDAGEK